MDDANSRFCKCKELNDTIHDTQISIHKQGNANKCAIKSSTESSLFNFHAKYGECYIQIIFFQLASLSRYEEGDIPIYARSVFIQLRQPANNNSIYITAT